MQADVKVLFVVGPPGVGKTTAIRGLIEPDSYFVMKPKWTVGDTVCAAGHYTGGPFDGADTVPYNGVAAALEFWAEKLGQHRLTILDGDRFSHAKALNYFTDHGADVRIALITAQSAALDARRVERGSTQNATWVKGRVSKANKFSTLGRRVVVDSTELAPEQVTEALRAFLEEA